MGRNARYRATHRLRETSRASMRSNAAAQRIGRNRHISAIGLVGGQPNINLIHY